MNEQQLIVARELADHLNFTWRKGLLPVYECAPYVWRHERVEEDGWNPQYCDDIAMPDGWPDVKREAWPDLTDAGTGGVLWEMTGRPSISVRHGKIAALYVGDAGEPTHCCIGLVGDTLGEACARLWLRQQAKAVVADSATTEVGS